MKTKEHFLALHQKMIEGMKNPRKEIVNSLYEYNAKSDKTIDDHFERAVNEYYSWSDSEWLEQHVPSLWVVGTFDPAKAFKEFLNAIDALIEITKPIKDKLFTLRLNSFLLVDAYSNAKLFGIDVSELRKRFICIKASFYIT